MTFDRDAIYAALYSQVTTALGASIGFSSRRFLEVGEIDKDEQPALLVVATRDTFERKPNTPTKHYLGALLVLYVRDDDPSSQPETQLFTLLRTIEASLQYQASDKSSPSAMWSNSTTLGGKVTHTWIREVEIHHGAGSGQAAATISVEMLAVEY